MHAPASVYLVIYVGVRHTLHWNALIFSQNNVCLCCGWMLHTEKTPKDRERMHKRQKEWMPFQYSECFQGVALILHIFHTVVLPCAQNKRIRLPSPLRRLHKKWYDEIINHLLSFLILAPWFPGLDLAGIATCITSIKQARNGNCSNKIVWTDNNNPKLN